MTSDREQSAARPANLDLPELGEQAGEAIRALNLRTRQLDAFETPSELCQVVADLERAAQGLPQLVLQLSRWLATRNADGSLSADDGRDPGLLAGHVVGALHAASSHADRLTRALDDAHQFAAHLALSDPQDLTLEQKQRRSIRPTRGRGVQR